MNAFLRSILFLTAITFFGASAPRPKTSLIPPGFVRMQAKDSIRPFLIGENPVSNFEYLLYQEWLKNVFLDYPEVHLNSLLKDYETDVKNPFNDPVVTTYLGHPAFANYPVLGATWIQAMEYCEWKNDRFNEAICKAISGREIAPSPSDISGENSFNTEAFLNGQYAFSSKIEKNEKYFFHDPYDYTINSPAKFPFFIWGCRLPTEEEWEYFQSGGKRAEYNFPEQSVLKYAEFLKLSPGNISTYSRKRAGGFEREENFYEWTLDVYSESKKKHSNPMSVFATNNLYVTEPKNGYLDQYGSLEAKDSLGKLGFRIMGWNPGGDALMVGRYRIITYKNYFLETDSAFLENVVSIYKESRIDSVRMSYKGYVQQHLYYLNGFVYYANGSLSIIVNGTYYSTMLPMPFFSAKSDLEYLRSSAQFLYRVKDTCYGCDGSGLSERVVRSARLRVKKKETKASANIGFRMVMPYYGNALPEPISW